MSKGGEMELYNIFFQQNKNNAFKNPIQQYLHQVKIPCFSVKQAQIREGKITENEILVVLTKILKNKSRGNDGITKRLCE